MSVQPQWVAHTQIPDPDHFQQQDLAITEWGLVHGAVAGEEFPGRMRIADAHGKYPKGQRRVLTSRPPSRPAAIELFDWKTGKARALRIDLDVALGTPETVALHSVGIAQHLRLAGLHPWIDAAPTGGRHVEALLPEPVAQEDIAAFGRGLRELYPTVDINPYSSVASGCLRPTGSRHKSGGWQRLIGPLEDLKAALAAVPAPDAWERLIARIPPVYKPDIEPAQVDRQPELVGVRLQGRHIGASMDALATAGPAGGRYRSDSEARYAIECAAIEKGFTDDEFVHCVLTQWTWLRHSYEDKGRIYQPTRSAKTIAYAHLDYARKSKSGDTQSSFIQNPNTSPRFTTAGGGQTTPLAIRKWLGWALTRARYESFTPHQRWVIIVLAFFALSKNSKLIDGGLRAYALGCGIGITCIDSTLDLLKDTGLIRYHEVHRGRKAETWELAVDLAQHSRPAPGWIASLRKAFLVLGPMAGEVYEHLVTTANRGKPGRRRKRPTGKGARKKDAISAAEIALALGYSKSAVSEVLAVLAGWDLAVYVPRRGTRKSGWIAGAADPEHVAELLDADELFEARRAMYARQRAIWHAWLDRYHWYNPAPDHHLSLFDIQERALAPPPDDYGWIEDVLDVPVEHVDDQKHA